MPRTRLQGLLGATAVPLAGLLAYAGQLRPGWAAPGGDVVNYVYPYAVYMARAWSQGRRPPLWNPDVFMGVPYLANIQAESLYPPNFLYLVAPAVPALAWLEALHVAAAGAGMYVYSLRAVRLGRAGAFVAAVIFMLGPFLTAQMAHVNQLDTLAWTPWLMLAVDRCARRPRLWLTAVIAALVGLILLAGHPQAAYFTLLLGLIAGLAALWPRLRRGRWREAGLGSAAAVLGVILGGGLAAAQLVPTAELVGQSIRAGGVEAGVATDSPLLLRGMLGTILPHYSTQLGPEVTGASLGAVALVLALLAVITRWRSAFVRGWLGLGLLCLWGASGHNGRLYDLLYHVVPGLALFRAPARLLLFTTIALALLAGMGTRVALVLVRTGRAGPVLAAGGLGLLPCLSVAAYELAGSPDLRWLHALPAAPGPAPADLALAAAFTCAVPAAWLAARRLARLRPGLAPALVLLVLCDTWLASQPIYARHPVPAAAYEPSGGARALISPDSSSRYITLVNSDLGLAPNQGMSSDRLSAEGYDGGVLPLRGYVEFRRPLLPPGSSNRPDFILAFLTDRIFSVDRLRETGTSVVIAADGADPNYGPCPCLTPGESHDGVRAWNVPQPLGRAWLDTGSGRLPQRVVTDSGERVEVAVEAGAEGGLLVLADTDYPGWAARVDGRPVQIQRWGGLLKAVPVPPGRHVAVFTFTSNAVNAGFGLSLASLLITVGIGLAGLRRRRLRRFWRA